MVVFNQVHRAEQALTMLMDEPDVARQALYERSGLLNSKIANAQEQISRLERAIHALGGEDYLAEPDKRRAG